MSDWIYGRNAVLEWLSARLPARELWVAGGENRVLQEIEQAAAKNRLAVRRVDRRRMRQQIGHDHHQGVILLADSEALYVEPHNLLRIASERGEPPFLALLDGVQDPHNLGAILRSADGAGLHGLIVPKDQSAGLSPAVFKASAGAAAHVAVARVTNLARTMDELKKEGVWLVGSEGDGERLYTQMDWRGAVGIVLGGEGKGLRRLVREKCDFIVSIPLCGKVNSLNVSVAAALLFFEARRQKNLQE
ncbi:23S rRNA (guanosine(2251)-2'-O)-methyltransferase RlmB [candidate division KSB1 bacterium]|nr:23S rRNA (guanosine(2251)-2'-O)-methyltransferase RlmB [candidate division KSB1 bacterium]